MSENYSEAEISMVLDTFMYLDYRQAREGTSLNNILKDLEDHPDYGGGGIHYGEYTVLKKASENREIGSLTIGCQSVNMGYDSGTAACTFTTPDKTKVYVVYRGTGDGEWPDNGIGMTSAATTQQKKALSYFEQVIETMNIKESQRLVVTGHSKGGNKAQFVTMETKYSGLIDRCYSVDGQGFSEKAIEEWKFRYGEKDYQDRRNRIYGIHGENDYVSVLGNGIIPKNHIRYVKTPVEKSNFAGYHDIKYMFASLEYDEKKGQWSTIFHGRKNSDTRKQGELGEYAALLSAGVMELPPDKRDGCAAVIMQLMEAADGQKKGINGEKLRFSDLGDFTLLGIPVIARSLFTREEGRALLSVLKNRDAQLGGLSPEVLLQVNYQQLFVRAELLEEKAAAIQEILEEVREKADTVPLYMKGSAAFQHRIKLSVMEMEKWNEKLKKAACLQRRSAQSYQRWNEKEFS